MKALENIFNSAKKFVGVGLIAGGLALSALTGCPLPGPDPAPTPVQTYPGPKTTIAFSEYNPNESFWKDMYNQNTGIDLWILNSDGSGIKKLSQGLEQGGRIKFSPTGKDIAFKGGQNFRNRIIDLEGNLLDEFNDWRDRSDEDFIWTPDGNSILYGRYTLGIYKYDLLSKTIQQILRTGGFTYDHNPVLSPDLKKIAFTHHEYESHYYIKIMNADGTNVQQIASGTGTTYDEQLNLNWLDNENVIWKNYGKERLYYCNVNTKTVLEINPEFNFIDMELSPDKKTLAIWGWEKGVGLIDVSELPSGKVTIKKTNKSDSYTTLFDWSPDGNYFVSGRNNWTSREGKTVVIGELKIYDREGNVYKLLDDSNLPERGYFEIENVSWSPLLQ